MAELDSNEHWDAILEKIRNNSQENKRKNSNVVEFDFENLPNLLNKYELVQKKRFCIPASAIVRAILKEKGANKKRLDIRFNGGTFSSTLHLEHLNFPGYLRFENCKFKGRLDLRYTNLGRLKFKDCVFDKIVEADVARVEGDVEVIDCKLQQGLVLRAAHVKGRIVVDGSEIGTIQKDDGKDFAKGFAIDANMVRAESGISLRNIDAKQNNKKHTKKLTMIFGGVDLTSSVIGGHLEFQSAKIHPDEPDVPAVDLTNGKVDGFLFVRETSEFYGKLNLFSAEIGLFSVSGGSKIINKVRPREPAIDGEGVRIATSFTLGEKVTVYGVNLSSAEIKGVFQFGGRADESGRTAIDEEVGPEPDQDTDFIVSEEWEAEGFCHQLDLTHARIGRLSIDFQSWEKSCDEGMLPQLNGCLYDDIVSISGRDSADKENLFKWVGTLRNSDDEYNYEDEKHNIFRIKKQNNYNPQVYHQIISVLVSKGRFDDLYKIEKKNLFYSLKLKYHNKNKLNYLYILANLFVMHLLGHGRSMRPLLCAAFISVLIPALAYGWGYHKGSFFPSNPLIYNEKIASWDDFVPNNANLNLLEKVFYFQNYNCKTPCDLKNIPTYPRKEYPSFSPFLYSLDVFLPLVDLSQEKSWSPVTSAGTFTVIWSVVVIQIIFGWLFSGLLIAYVSGVVRPKS